jgi:tetratricopeptide (TPR) repeat protein
MYDRLARDHPSFEHYTYKLAMCLNDLGNEQAGLGLEADARRSHERCLALRRQIVRDHPDVPEYQKELGIGYGVWAARQYAAGLISESLASELKAREVFERLVRQHSDVADYSHRLSGTLQDIGGRLGEVGRTDEALTALREALSVSERLNRDHPEVLHHQTNLAACHSAIGWLCYRLTDLPEESLASYVKSRAIYAKIVRDNPELKPYRLYLATLDQQVARVLMRLGRKDEALRYYHQALEVKEADVRANSSSEWSRRDLGYCHFEIGRLHEVAGRGTQASASWQKALTIFEALAESNALDPYNLACAQAICASLVGAGKATLSPAEETRRARYAERAVATLSKAADGGLQSLSMVASDPDFDAIRSRDDFQSLVAGLKAKSQARATPSPVAGEKIGVTRP